MTQILGIDIDEMSHVVSAIKYHSKFFNNEGKFDREYFDEIINGEHSLEYEKLCSENRLLKARLKKIQNISSESF